MLKMPRMMAVLGAMLAALLITGAALAQQTPPHTFYGYDGSVTIDGENAPGGTTITAMAGGENVGMATVGADGSWSLDVAGGTNGVTFMVNGMAASGSYDAPQGQSMRISLAVTSATDESDELEGDGGTMDGGDTGTEMGEDDGGELEDDGGTEMEGGELEGNGGELEGETSPEEADGSAAGDGTNGVNPNDEMPPPDDGDQEPPVEEEDTTDADVMDSNGATDSDDSLDDSDGGGAMDGEEGAMDSDDGAMDEGATGYPDTGTGGLADSSRGVSSAVYGGIAGALALIALAGGVAVRRRAQS